MRSLIPDDLDDELNSLQMDIASRQIPVAVIFEGGSGHVISKVINEINRGLEPMGVSYHHFDAKNKGTGAFAELLNATPGKGEIVLYDRSWYSMAVDWFEGDDEQMEQHVESINRFEEYLMDNGTYVIKIGLDVKLQTLKKYAAEYGMNRVTGDTFLSVDHIDRVKYRAVMPDIVRKTDTKRVPWDIVETAGVEDTVKATVKLLIKRLKQCLDMGWDKSDKKEICKMFPNPRKGLDLNGDSKDYGNRMDILSGELERLQNILAISGRSLVLCFEGWDAAGKGGAIKHLCHALNPRGYTVARIKAPTDIDYAHTYLWRFAKHLPSAGRVSVFDRTWYGRMMVEPIEGFCDDDEYCRSAEEINNFEKMITEAGGIVVKFWLDIDKDTQLERFNERQNDPLKQWKLTDEDWRNREKWDKYEEYINAMIYATNTSYAPWVAVPANNKKAARLFVLETVISKLKEVLEN